MPSVKHPLFTDGTVENAVPSVKHLLFTDGKLYNAKASRFVERIANSDETIDGNSKPKAYALSESGMIDVIDLICFRKFSLFIVF